MFVLKFNNLQVIIILITNAMSSWKKVLQNEMQYFYKNKPYNNKNKQHNNKKKKQ